jgi:1-acyl-sn-glycerol-3-phosphate acyltransferase
MRLFFRQAARMVALILLTLALLPVQIVAVALLPRFARSVPVLYHRVGARILGLDIGAIGRVADARPLLIVANHVSWLDIPLIAAALPVSFIAKHEVRDWPVFGVLAKLQHSVFVDRTRSRQSAAANSEIAERLLAGDVMVLFAEGTSGDGHDVLPFRSALIGAATQACARMPAGRICIQPLAVTYVGEARRVAPWYGEMDLVPHFAEILRAPALRAVLSWGEPVAYSGQSDRKQVAKKLEAEIRMLVRRVRAECA